MCVLFSSSTRETLGLPEFANSFTKVHARLHQGRLVISRENDFIGHESETRHGWVE
jgi:hypothetical protein